MRVIKGYFTNLKKFHEYILIKASIFVHSQKKSEHLIYKMVILVMVIKKAKCNAKEQP